MPLHSLEFVTDARIHLTMAFFVNAFTLLLEISNSTFTNLIKDQEIVVAMLRGLFKVKEETRVFSNLGNGPFNSSLFHELILGLYNR